jgi:hypothetical protein
MEATTEGIRVREGRVERLAAASRALAALLGVGYIAAGVVGAALGATGGDRGDLAVWLLLLAGGGALVLVGSFALEQRSGLAVTVTAIGAAAGALALFWTVIVPVLAAALVALIVVDARRRSRS